MKKLIIFALPVVALIVFTACNAAGSDNIDYRSISDSGKITPLQDLSYDWKEINIEGGTVDRQFTFRNEGDDDLILKGAITSCMCTTATFELSDGQSSPAFGMHENKQWDYAVKPGEEFRVNVVFDPMAHGPEAIGPIQRSIYLFTSSVTNGEYAKFDQRANETVTELKLSGNVLKKSAFEQLQLKNADASSADLPAPQTQ